MTTFAPSFANRMAMARPMPELPPVTIAVLPANEINRGTPDRYGVCIRSLTVEPPASEACEVAHEAVCTASGAGAERSLAPRGRDLASQLRDGHAGSRFAFEGWSKGIRTIRRVKGENPS